MQDSCAAAPTLPCLHTPRGFPPHPRPLSPRNWGRGEEERFLGGGLTGKLDALPRYSNLYHEGGELRREFSCAVRGPTAFHQPSGGHPCPYR